MAKAKTKTTIDHDEIRRWAERHGGKPAAVKSTHRTDDPGILRIMFPKAPHSEHDNLEEISWDAFFEKFDENGLALVYEEDRNFGKLVSRESAETKAHRTAGPKRREAVDDPPPRSYSRTSTPAHA